MSDKIKAIIWMLGAMGSLLAVSICGKILSHDYNTFEIMFYRSIFGFLFFVIYLLVRCEYKTLHIKRLDLHMLRNALHFTAQNLWFYALAALPLSVVVAFEFTTPAWVIVIGAIAFGEKFGWQRMLVILLALIGIYIITGPSQVHLNIALLSAILCAIGFALTMIATRKLTKHQSVNEILLMMTLIQGAFAGAIIFAIGSLESIHQNLLPWLMLIGLFGTLSHFCMTHALKLADASVVSPIDLLRLPMSILLGYFMFGEPIAIIVLLGTAFLILANYLNIRIKSN